MHTKFSPNKATKSLSHKSIKYATAKAVKVPKYTTRTTFRFTRAELLEVIEALGLYSDRIACIYVSDEHLHICIKRGA